MKTVFLYAGQGSQKVGMGKDIYEQFPTYRKMIDEIDATIHVKTLMHEGPMENLTLTENTQPCMAAFAAGVTAVLKENGITADAACGLSLGEYGALHAAGVFDAKTYVDLVAFRGKAMAEAAKGKSCSMSAVLGMDKAIVEEACNACQDAGYVTLVNYNCPGQYVICGDEEAVAKTEEGLKEHGAKRCIRLNVSGPFHTKYMAPAADKLMQKMQETDFANPQIPVVLNVTGDFYDRNADLKELLQLQIQNGVHFEESIGKLLEAGATTFIEIGPGNTLTGFVKKTAKAFGNEVTCVTIDSAKDLENVLGNKEEYTRG